MESRKNHFKSSVQLDLDLKIAVLLSKMAKLLFSVNLSMHCFDPKESI